MLDLENPKSRNLFLWLYLDEREYFLKISAKLFKKALKTGFFWISRKSGSKIRNSFLVKAFPWPIQSKIGPAVLEGTNKHTDRQTLYCWDYILILRNNIWPIYLKSLWNLNQDPKIENRAHFQGGILGLRFLPS